MLRTLFLATILAAAAPCSPFEDKPEGPAFEAASVKPAQPPGPGSRFTPLGGGPGTKSPTRLAGTATMMMLLMRAYGVKSYQISGPAWTEMEMYEIAANVPASTTREQLAPMLQNLLRERFHLAIHRETRDLPMYVLLVGKTGPKLKESDPAAAAEDEKAAAEVDLPRLKVTMGADGFPQIPADARLPSSFALSLADGEFARTKLFAKHQTMDELAGTIGGYVNRPVRNLTELQGRYDFTLAFESETRGAARPAGTSPDGAPPPPAETGPGIFAAVQKQLGLRMEQRRGPVEMLIVDKLEKTPTEN